MIYQNIRNINEVTINTDDKSIKINISNKWHTGSHGARVKVEPRGSGATSGFSTCAPITREIYNFDELISHKASMRYKNGTDKYLEFIVGFIVMNHSKLVAHIDYFENGGSDTVTDRMLMTQLLNDYSNKYNYKDISRIRNDANEHVRLIRAGVIPDT